MIFSLLLGKRINRWSLLHFYEVGWDVYLDQELFFSTSALGFCAESRRILVQCREAGSKRFFHRVREYRFYSRWVGGRVSSGLPPCLPFPLRDLYGFSVTLLWFLRTGILADSIIVCFRTRCTCFLICASCFHVDLVVVSGKKLEFRLLVRSLGWCFLTNISRSAFYKIAR